MACCDFSPLSTWKRCKHILLYHKRVTKNETVFLLLRSDDEVHKQRSCFSENKENKSSFEIKKKKEPAKEIKLLNLCLFFKRDSQLKQSFVMMIYIAANEYKTCTSTSMHDTCRAAITFTRTHVKISD